MNIGLSGRNVAGKDKNKTKMQMCPKEAKGMVETTWESGWVSREEGGENLI